MSAEASRPAAAGGHVTSDQQATEPGAGDRAPDPRVRGRAPDPRVRDRAPDPRTPRTDPLDGIDLIVFDKDGTLIEFHLMWGGWVDDLAHKLEASTGLRLRDGLDELLGVDPGTGMVRWNGLLAATPMARIRDAVEAYVAAAGAGAELAGAAMSRAWTAPDPVALARPVTDLAALFARLRRRVGTFAVATSDDRGPTERTLASLGIAGELAAVACADDGIPNKPAPDPVLRICSTLGIPPERTAVVGDSPADLAMGRAAGAGRVIAVLTGVGDAATLGPLADVVLPSIEDLAPA
ncbi:MAG TPA: HAD family hydrolase [Candidatus Binatia bacterium]|nr:HAD family hydrolase [Candidatus Binatia bacterium]